MSLFGRKKSALSDSQIFTQANIELAMVTESGHAFEHALGKSATVPSGHLFLNRFLHAPYTELADIYEDVRDDMRNDATLLDSLDKLASLLDKLTTEPTPLPVIQALEEATTANLTGYTCRAARGILNDRPDLRSHPMIDDSGFAVWDADLAVTTFAYFIRDNAAPLDVAIRSSAKHLEREPGKCLRLCRSYIDVIGERLRENADEEIDNFFADATDMVASMVKQMRLMDPVTAHVKASSGFDAT